MEKKPEKSVSEAIQYRRSVRVFKKDAIDENKVKECIRLATLAPTSDNLQLWEFYHIVSTDILDELKAACFNQNAARTANQMVVVVSRKDLWKKRLESNITSLKTKFGVKPESEYSKAERSALNYYQKAVPKLYSDFIGIRGTFKFIFHKLKGLFKPVHRESRHSDMRIVAHKSTALAAQNFMISMSAINYDTCPMEGYDSSRVKKILNLPSSVEITMIISCGIREDHGVYGTRFRVPFEEVYFKK